VRKQRRKIHFVKAQMKRAKELRMRRSAPRKAGRPPGGVNGQRVRDYPQVSIRVPPKLYAQLATITRETGMSRLQIFIEAIDCFEHSRRAARGRPHGRRRADTGDHSHT
jgi:hypothetical protein